MIRIIMNPYREPLYSILGTSKKIEQEPPIQSNTYDCD